MLLLLGLGACSSTSRSAEEEFEQGNMRMDGGDLVGAIRSYNAALDSNPRMAKAFNNRGLACAALKDYSSAIADYNSCLSLGPPFSEVYYNRGVARFRLGERTEAIVDFTEALKLTPAYPRAHAARGLVFKAAGDARSALADFRKALELAPLDWSDRKSVEAEVAKLAPEGERK